MDVATLREDMVDSLEHESKGVLSSPALSIAMREVPRERFVVAEGVAYEDRPSRAHGTTVLAPSLVAVLLEALSPRPDDRVLVVGAGVGYTAAVLAELVGASNVHAVDIDRTLVLEARRNLERAGYGAVLVDHRDGAHGLPEYAPFDRILVEAAGVEPPHALRTQLTPGGRLIMPSGVGEQRLVAYSRADIIDTFGPVAFRPLLVDGEQSTALERNRTEREDREFADRHQRSRTGWEHEWIDWS